MKTHLKDVIKVGSKPVALMVPESVFLAGLFYGLLTLAEVSTRG